MAFLFASVALLSLGACTEKSAQTVLHQIGSGGKSIKASGNYVTKSYSVGKFSTIEASGVATVVYTQTSGPQKVEVCTSDNLMEYVYVKVNDGNLLVGIKYDGAIQSLDKFEVRVSSPSLSGVDLRGASKVCGRRRHIGPHAGLVALGRFKVFGGIGQLYRPRRRCQRLLKPVTWQAEGQDGIV